MALFLNKKEQVIDFKLTQYGKRLFSEGKLRPKYYSFYDNDILYDHNYQSNGGVPGEVIFGPDFLPVEPQNAAVSRIKNTERITPITNFQEALGNNSVGVVSPSDLLAEFDQMASSRERTYVLNFQKPIGSNSPWEPYAPAWQVRAMSGSNVLQYATPNVYISGSIPNVSGSLKIAYSSTTEQVYDSETDDFVDKEFFVLDRSDRLLLNIEEINAIYNMNGNFDIEVYKMKEGDDQPIEKLHFINNESNEAFELRSQTNPAVFSQLLMGTDEEIEENFTRLDETFVEYYLSLKVDDEIDEPITRDVSLYGNRQGIPADDLCD